MDTCFTREHQLFADSVDRFARDKLADQALARAHTPRYPFDVAQLMAEQGLLGITIPEADGGIGGTLMQAVIAIQQVARFCPRSADVIQAGNFGAIRTLAEFATADQKARFLPRLLSGKEVISLAMTEPDAGSAVTDLRTNARKDGDRYIINGSKIYSTHSADASIFLVYVRFSPGANGIGSALVERGTPGLSIAKPSTFMSGEEWSELQFEECVIPAENILLGPGGFKKQMSGFNIERIGNAARSLAVGNYAYEIARKYAMVRRQFNRPICEFQGLQWKFADLAMKMDGAQLLLHRAVESGKNGLPSAYETAVAKMACNLAGFEAANEAMQIMGGLGYSAESLVEYCMRRTRGWMIAGGSVEILKNRIAEHIFDRRFDQRGRVA